MMIKRIVFLLAWQFVASFAFLLIGGVMTGLPFWLLGPREGLYLGLLFLAYLVSTLVPSAFAISNHRLHILLLAVLTASAFVLAFLSTPIFELSLQQATYYLAYPIRGWLDLLHMPLFFLIVMGSVAMLLNVVLVRATQSGPRVMVLPVLATALLAVASLPGIGGGWIYTALQRSQTDVVKTAYYPIRVNYFRGRFPRTGVDGGGLISTGDGMLLVTGGGLFYSLAFSTGGDQMTTRALGEFGPINAAEFRTGTPQVIRHDRFRVLDLMLLDAAGENGKRLLVSHHYWDTDRSCVAIRVSSLQTSWDDFLSGQTPARWQTLFETRPCLPVEINGTPFFKGHQAGGRMARAGSGHILLAVGDQGFDGEKTSASVSQDMNSDYGKIIEINITNGVSRIITSGHRNPQGLVRDEQGRVWSTEHGPQGGDELNLIQTGRNYGWPMQTLGTQYGEYVWEPQEHAKQVSDLEGPVFAWIPSIGISSLISVDGDHFRRWRGDLLISSLRAHSLYRLRLEGDMPVMVEEIPVYERVRDIAQDERGRIIFWTDSAIIGLIRLAGEPPVAD